MKVRTDINQFISTIDPNITVVAATKYVDSNEMRTLYKNGITNFGENRTDKFLKKYDELHDLDNVTWHFIGHLQRNKAKEVINKIDYLHSLDSLELAKLIDKYRDKPLNTFIEVSINLEENKNGVPADKIEDFLSQILQYKNINVIGFMMMAYKEGDDHRDEFNKLVSLRDELEKTFNKKFPYLSMGMSNDYKQAIECGSTHIRIGRILFTDN